MKQQENSHVPKKSPKELYEELINDNELNDTLMGFPATQLEVHADDYHPNEISRIHSDEELELVIKDLLKNSSQLDSRDLTVRVDKCNVTLSGSVKSQTERDYALSLCNLVHGVGNVRSEMVVKTNEGILPSDVGRKDRAS